MKAERIIKTVPALTAALLLCAGGVASATTITWYDDEEALYNLSDSWAVLENFELQDVTSDSPTQQPPGTDDDINAEGFTISGSDLAVWQNSDNVFSTHGDWPTSGEAGHRVAVTWSASTTFAFDRAVNAMGMTLIDWADRNDNLTTITLTHLDDTEVTYAFPNEYENAGDDGFFFLGFTSSELFHSVTLSGLGTVDNPGDGAGIDGVMAGVVPEPATMTLFGLGLAGLAARTIRRKRG